jgi:hypothetical protein
MTKKILPILTAALLAAAHLSTYAQSVESCNASIKYNSSELEQNHAVKLAVWESVDKETFDKSSTSGSGMNLSPKCGHQRNLLLGCSPNAIDHS